MQEITSLKIDPKNIYREDKISISFTRTGKNELQITRKFGACEETLLDGTLPLVGDSITLDMTALVESTPQHEFIWHLYAGKAKKEE